MSAREALTAIEKVWVLQFSAEQISLIKSFQVLVTIPSSGAVRHEDRFKYLISRKNFFGFAHLLFLHFIFCKFFFYLFLHCTVLRFNEKIYCCSKPSTIIYLRIDRNYSLRPLTNMHYTNKLLSIFFSTKKVLADYI